MTFMPFISAPPVPDQDCPPNLVGRVDTVSIGRPSARPGRVRKGAGDRKAPARTGQRALAPGTIVEDPDLHELALTMPGASPRIAATYGTDRGLRRADAGHRPPGRNQATTQRVTPAGRRLDPRHPASGRRGGGRKPRPGDESALAEGRGAARPWPPLATRPRATPPAWLTPSSPPASGSRRPDARLLAHASQHARAPRRPSPPSSPAPSPPELTPTGPEAHAELTPKPARAHAKPTRKHTPKPAHKHTPKPPGAHAELGPRTAEAGPAADRPGAGQQPVARAHPVRAGPAMAGFDTCAAPSLPTMKAWRAKYAATAIYIGGQMMACGQSNLSASWVQQAKAMGWALMPTFVGLQAPCDSFSGKINAKQAASQGTAAASQAVTAASSYGLGTGSPIYYDMEAYDHTNAGCRTAVLTFLDAWTRQLEAGGLRAPACTRAPTPRSRTCRRRPHRRAPAGRAAGRLVRALG